MGKSIRELLNVLNDDLSPSATNTYASIIAAAFFLYIAVFCMFIVIMRKKIQPEEEINKGFDAEMGQSKK